MTKHSYLKSFLLLFSLSIFSFANAQYCAVNFSVANWSKIMNVKLVGNNNTIDNASSNCDGYKDFTSLTPADLAAGGTYSLEVFKSNCTYNYQNQCNVWIDYNGNGTFETTEALGNKTNTSSGDYTYVFNFTVPCNITSGTTRMRICLNEDIPPAACGTQAYGEAEDYSVSLSVPPGLSSNFFAPDTVYIGTITTFVNANQTGYISHNWTVNGTSTYNSTNAAHIFTTAGTYNVKLVSTNCLGSDSTTKTVVAIAPTAPPIADFVSTKNVVEIFDNFELIDLSTNGATYWNWYIHNGYDTIVVAQGGDPYTHRNPVVYTGTNPTGFPKIFPDQGKWTVCLQSSNVIGSSAVTCKTNYIEVRRTSYSIGPETSLPANVITAPSGTIFDKGGEFNNYTVPESNLEALIAPCGAASVSLNFKTFKLNANANLKIYDGVNALGKVLHSGSGFTAGNAPSGTITATSGALYMLWNSSAGAVDSGFAAVWSSVAGSGAAPVANFALPADTIYNAVFENFINTSTNAEGSTTFLWSINGTPVANSRDLENQIFLTNGSYVIKLDVTGCDGSTSSKSKTVIVAHPGSPTNADFIASNRRPAVGDNVVFTATSNKANRWDWAFFPPLAVTPTGTISNQLKERTFRFDQPGVYAVQLKAYNTVDTNASEKTIVKTGYIVVVEHCVPIISVTTSTDIGISYVSLEDDASGEINENSSATGIAYQDFSDLGVLELNFGGKYNFEVKRNSNINPMTRKIWIDWNVDGDFTDAGELVASQASGTSLSWTGSFTVPDISKAFEANTRLRIGVSYGNDLNLPCGANSNPAANRIGEFEDYAIRVVNDGDKPVITLIGADTLFVEQTSTPTYISPGATAYDASQGDITPNVVVTTDVDQTLPGVYYEVYNAADASGNQATPVIRVIYVVFDQTPPVLTVNGSTDTTINVGTAWNDLGATAVDAKEGNLTDAIVISGSVNEALLGTYTITYSVQDNQGNAASATRTVRVVDTEVPTINNAIADKTNAALWVVDVQLQSIFVDVTNATDNYNSLSNKLSFKANPASVQGGAEVDTRFQGTTSVIYTATDESGNTTTQAIDYVVKDYVPPVIDLRTLDVIYHPVNSVYTPVDATASDNLYNTTQISLTKTSNVNPYVLGTYADTYTATDAAGNVSVKVRTVHVVDRIAPLVAGKNGGVLRVGVGSQFNILDYILFSDNYDSPADLIDNHTLVYNDINVWEEGTYSAAFQTVDNSGNESAEYIIIVKVDYDFFPIKGSVSDIALENLLTVNPNPTSGLLNININLAENEDITLSIYNAVGKEVLTINNDEIANGLYTVDLSNNANGIYYVKMNVKGSIITKKVILNK
jgi:PKD repeat protein